MKPSQIFIILNRLISGINKEKFQHIFGRERGNTLHKEFIRYDFNFLEFYNNRLSKKDQETLHLYLAETNLSLQN